MVKDSRLSFPRRRESNTINNMAKKLIVFNWKMYPKKLQDVEGILMAFDGATLDLETYGIVIAPPAVYIPLIANVFYELKAHVGLALQNCAWGSEGAFTGELSADMGKNFGVDHVIVGHSERRQYFGETDVMIGKKAAAAIKAGLVTILCVGEPADVRKKGKAAVKQYIRKQIDGALRELESSALRSKKIVLAYEPIWAIGTGVAATPEDAVEVIAYIKAVLAADYTMTSTRVLYGGSVNGKNIMEFIQQGTIDGALVGGASVDKKEFKKIINVIANT